MSCNRLSLHLFLCDRLIRGMRKTTGNSAKCRLPSLISHGGNGRGKQLLNCSFGKYLWDSFGTQHAYPRSEWRAEDGRTVGRSDGEFLYERCPARIVSARRPTIPPGDATCIHRAKVRQFQSWHISKKERSHQKQNEVHFPIWECTEGPFLAGHKM